MKARVPGLLAMALVCAGALSAQTAPCGERAWSSIGVGAFHCPGGVCAFETGDGASAFRFTTEPWLRAIDPTGPAAGSLVEGDVLVAVDRWLITSPEGGRALADMPADGGRLTVRRGDRLVEVDIVPAASCEPPLIVIGNRLPVGGGSSDAGGPDRIDYTAPRRIGPSALDLSLGMGLRCPGCRLSMEGRPRWIVPSPPVVELVERDGVAEEAGLQPGDRILAIDGRDVTSRRGGQLLHAMPRGDFEISYERDGERRTARMNRRIIVQRIIIDGERIVQIRQGHGEGGLFGAISRWFRQLLRGSDDVGSDDVGESWGSVRLGARLGGDGGRLFEMDAGGGVRLDTRPVVVEVAPGGPAATAGLRPGDVLTHVDDRDVRSDEAAGLLFRAEPGRALALRYLRDGDERRTTLIPEEE